MKQTRLSAVLLVLIALLLLAACGGQGGSVGDSYAPGTGPAAATSAPAAATSAPAAATSAPAAATSAPAAATSAPAAGGRLEQIKQKGKLIVGTSADYPPYESVDQAGNFVGFDMDIIREVGKRLGVEVEIQDLGFDVLIASLQEGKVDAVISAMQATPERDEKVDFTRQYHMPKDAFLIAGDSDVQLSSPKDAAKYVIGVQTGTAQARWVEENLIKPGLMTEDRLQHYERTDQAALDLENGRIDVLIIIADPARELAEQRGLKIALETSETIAAGQAIAIPEGASDLKAEMDRVLEQMEQEGFITKLQEQYKIP